MSKYYKTEDVQELITACIWRMTLAKERNGEGFVEYDKQIIDVSEFRKRLSNLPTIEVSEDAISREWVKGICEDMLDEEMLGHMLGCIEDAPSVVPKPREGEWIPCTKEGYPLTELGRREGQKWYGYKCPKCNFIYKGNALTESPFCQNCGAKMKG